MEPVSTALAGIALVKSSVDFIKGNLDTVKDIGEIAGAIGNLLDAESQINKQRFQDTSLKDSAQHVIDAKLARENINEISMLIDLRFGPGTWQSILAERNKRIEENKQIEKERRAAKRRQQEEIMNVIKWASIVVIGVGILTAVFTGLFIL